MTRGAQTSYSYDRADRILTAGSVPYSVNENGNLLSRGPQGQQDLFTYDQANRLTSSSLANGGPVNYRYDGDGKRIKREVGTTTTYTYLYDDNRSMPVILEDGFRRNVWGLGLAYAIDIQFLEAAAARPAAGMTAPAAAPGDILIYHNDGLGSVRAITDVSGNVTEIYQTNEFAVPISRRATLPSLSVTWARQRMREVASPTSGPGCTTRRSGGS